MRSLRRNLPVLAMSLGTLLVAVGLHFSEPLTGRMWMPHVAGDYGTSTFQIGGPAYPRHAVDAEGYRITISKPPERIAVTEWTIEEFVYPVVRPERVVAVSRSAFDRKFSNVFPFAEQFKPTLSTNTENLLKVVPDLIISTPENSNRTNILQSAGIPVFRMYTQFTKMEEILQNIKLIGYLTGEDAAADKLYEKFQLALQRAKQRKPAGMSPPRILGYQFAYSYGEQTSFHAVVDALGGINVGAEHGLKFYDAISSEQVMRWNPEWIVSGSDRGMQNETLKRILDDPAVRMTTAARKGQIVVLESNIFLPRSPYMTLILDALGEILYGPDSGS